MNRGTFWHDLGLCKKSMILRAFLYFMVNKNIPGEVGTYPNAKELKLIVHEELQLRIAFVFLALAVR